MSCSMTEIPVLNAAVRDETCGQLLWQRVFTVADDRPQDYLQRTVGGRVFLFNARDRAS